MAIEDPELIQAFIADAGEALEAVDQELIKLEREPHSPEILNSIFRGIHTIKGTAGFFELTKLQKLAHVGENILDALRSQKIAITEARSSALLEMVDAIKFMLSQVAENGTDGSKTWEELITRLETLKEETGEVTIKSPSVPETAQAVQESQDIQSDTITPEVATANTKSTPVTPQPTQQALRIDVKVLDNLMNLVGELVLARNQLLQCTEESPETPIGVAVQRLHTITSELQDGVMRARLQPIGSVWKKFPRVVRDLSKQCNKSISLVMMGEETELDKTVLEAIQDPLTHLIRNSIDHGIELPSARVASGKPQEATITLRATHQGEHILIEIIDDGAGLNTERIKEKALERGLVSRERLDSMSHDEINALIFAPGFSTAQAVTSISGRGVGMDVVRSNIERVGGSVRVESARGKGCTVHIRLPLTLLIAPALTLAIHGELFALPQHHILELVQIERTERGTWPFERIAGGVLYPLRDELLPIIDLAEALDRPSLTASEAHHLTLIVVESQGNRFGIIVGEIFDTQELVVKPLCKPLRALQLYSGATIMGDGSLALMLYMPGIAAKAALELGRKREEHCSRAAQEQIATLSYLKVRSSDNHVVGIPLTNVIRLEEIVLDELQSLPHAKTMRYHETLLPLFDLTQCHRTSDPIDKRAPTVPVVICRDGSQEFGVIVHSILDIVETEAPVLPIGKGAFIEGAALIDNAALSVLNVAQVTERLLHGDSTI
jgi:two-component system chemotaxis sensor kinase CheA